MARLVPRTLFGQLLLGILVVQTLFLAGFLDYIVVSQRQVAVERTQKRLDQQLDMLAAACAKSLAVGDLGGVRDALDLSRISTGIAAARLTDLTGKTVVVSESGRQELDSKELSILNGPPQKHIFPTLHGQLEAVTPVELYGKPIGMLWLEPSHTNNVSTAMTLVRISMTYGLTALLINVVPIFFIVRMTTRPLRRLREATQHVAQERTPASVFPLPITTVNEAGELTRSFNVMVHTLEEQRSGLLETLALLDSMLENAPIGFGFFDTEKHVVRSNRLLAEMFGGLASSDMGKTPREIVGGVLAEKMEASVEQVLASGEDLRNVELTSTETGNGEPRRSWLVHFYPVRTEGTIHQVGVIGVEITERLQTEETLRRTEKLAATGRLAASIAHEINNPLEAVTNLLYLLRTHDGLHPDAIAFVETAEAELERVSEITQQTLRFHRQSSAPSETHVGEMLDSVVKLYQSRIAATQILVRREYRGNPTVFGFGGELRQVFANFIGNALDAMPNGGTLVLRAREATCGRMADGSGRTGVRISVADTGTGMSETTLRRAFEAFFTTKQATGTGLGLWLSEEIVRKHQGWVSVKSRTGRNSGTVFSVFFPEDNRMLRMPAIHAGQSRLVN